MNSLPKLTPPKLEATKRDDAKDLIKYIAFKKQMKVFLQNYDLLKIVEGKEIVSKPNFDAPTKSEIRSAKLAKATRPKRYKNILRRKAKYELYMKFIERKNNAMAILSGSLSPEATVEFLKDENDNDVTGPYELFQNIDSYFLYNTEIIVQNLKSEIARMKIAKSETMEELGNKMKLIYYYLYALGRPVDDETKKSVFATAILHDNHSNSEQRNIIINIISTQEYTKMTFEKMILTVKGLEQYLKAPVFEIEAPPEIQAETKVKPALSEAKVELPADTYNTENRNQTDSANIARYQKKFKSRHSYQRKESSNDRTDVKFKWYGTCFRCGGRGHREDDCPSEIDNSEKRNSTKRNKRSRDDEDADDYAEMAEDLDGSF